MVLRSNAHPKLWTIPLWMTISTWSFVIVPAQGQSNGNGGGEPLIPRACAPPHDEHKFCDSSLPLDERLNDLIGQLTLEEKSKLLVARESPQGNISRLGIPECT